MKVTFTSTIACLVLLAACIFARPSKHHDSSSSEEQPENNKSDLTIIPAAADLFTAIVTPGKYWQAHQPIVVTSSHFCQDIYNIKYLKEVFGSGQEIRGISRIPEPRLWFYLLRNNVQQLQQQFAQNIAQCGKLEESDQRLDCYTEVIVEFFKAVEPRSINKKTSKSIKKVLSELSTDLTVLSIKRDKCLSIVPTTSTTTSTTQSSTATGSTSSPSTGEPTSTSTSTGEPTSTSTSTGEPTSTSTSSSAIAESTTEGISSPASESSSAAPGTSGTPETTTEDSSASPTGPTTTEAEASTTVTEEPITSTDEPSTNETTESETTVTETSSAETTEAAA